MVGKTDTRDEILRRATRLLQSNGFNGFSYAHIAKELGIKAAAVHYHFPTKADLGLALVDRFRTRYRLWMEDGVDLPVVEQLRGFFFIYSRHARGEGRVCPTSALEVEFDAIPADMRGPVRDTMRMIHDWLTELLERGRSGGELTFEGPPTAMATVVISALQGALQLGRPLGPECYPAAEAQLWRLLGVSAPVAPP